MAKKYYFDYKSVPGLFKNSLAEADAVGSAFEDCVLRVLKEYGIHIDSANIYNEVYRGNNRFGGFIMYYDRSGLLTSVEKAISVWFTAEGKLLVDFKKDPLISENTNDEIVEDIKEEAVKCQLLEKDSQTYVSERSSGGCYVATAVYGSYDCPEVWTLRRYRDYKLSETWYGRLFIKCYYAVSPTVVKLFGKTEWFNRIWKVRLDKMVAYLKQEGFDDTPYND